MPVVVKQVNPYPAIPADLASPVIVPALREGQDARSALAQNRAALKMCVAEQGALVGWYQKLRNTRKG